MNFLRILQVTPYFAPAWAYGGPPLVVQGLSTALARMGHEVTVLTSDALSPGDRMSKSHAQEESIEVHYLPNLSNYLAWHHQLYLPLGTGAFLRNRLADFDVMHVHMFRTYQNILAHQHCRKSRVAYVLSAHGSLPRVLHKVPAKSVFDALYGWRVLRDAAQLIAVSEVERRQYEGMGIPRARISVVPNGIDRSLWSEDRPVPFDFREHFGIPARVPLVLFVGRLDATKGLPTLLEAFRVLRRAVPNACLVLAGPDYGEGRRLRAMCKALAMGSSVLFTGPLTRPQTLAAYRAATLAVLPSRFESFGLVALEAAASGCPVLVTKRCGVAPLLEAAGAMVVEPEPGPFADAIRSVIEEPSVREAQVQATTRIPWDGLSWDAVAGRLANVYESIWDGA